MCHYISYTYGHLLNYCFLIFFFFSSRRRHTRLQGDWSSDVCSSDLLPLLLPLALLAGAGVPSLRRGAANALTWFGAMRCGLLGAVMWLGWFAMMTGFPPTIARNFAKLEPGHVPQFSWTVLAAALAFTLAWLWLILRGERSVFRSVTFWAAGITLLWGL